MTQYVITLIADAKRQPLSADLVSAVAEGVRATKIDWLAEGEACDVYWNHGDMIESEHALENAIERQSGALADAQRADVILQPVQGRRKTLLIADMESTIITVECLDELAEFAGLKEKVSAITARAMNGELDFEQALRERVRLLAGLSADTLETVYRQRVAFAGGARELVASMRKNGAYTMLVSGGFDFFTARVARELGFDEHNANRLEIEDGKLTGEVLPPILGKEAKLAALHEGCRKRGVRVQDSLAVGDGANDLPMLLAAGMGVAYHAKPKVRAAAKTHVHYSDLRALLYAQGYHASEIIL